MTDLVLFVVIFLVAGAGLLLAPLMMGRLVRPHRPSPEKGTVYECGEPTIGSAWVQFDLRFYVVALLFVIFDVELAFFFPWAVVFGSATRLTDPALPAIERRDTTESLLPTTDQTYHGRAWLRAAADAPPDPGVPSPFKGKIDEQAAAAKQLAWLGFADILVFFGVLLVGFAYLWRRGDLEWVRSTAGQVDRQQSSPVATGGRSEHIHGAVREPV